MVELSSGDVAIVVAHNRVRRLKPRVLLVTGPDKTPLSRPTSLDLLYCPGRPEGGRARYRRSLPPARSASIRASITSNDAGCGIAVRRDARAP